MNRILTLSLTFFAALLLAGCGNNEPRAAENLSVQNSQDYTVGDCVTIRVEGGSDADVCETVFTAGILSGQTCLVGEVHYGVVISECRPTDAPKEAPAFSEPDDA